MIAADQWRAYNAAVDAIRSAAEDEVREAVLSWLSEHPRATVAEAREEAASIMRGVVQRHDKAAASLAAEWYDAQGRANGVALDRAVTAPTYSAGSVDALVRYQVRKYQDGGLEGFAAMCGEFAANEAMRSVNETILRNTRRDRSKGVRFARVTSGRNTCSFCLMLAGRGAVYHTRESAGEFNRWHRHCTCKVVPSFSGDKWETLVEGHDPRDAKRWSDRIEAARKARQAIPAFPGNVSAEAEELQDALDAAWSAHLGNGGDVSSYRESYAKVVSSAVPENPIEIEDFAKLEGKELQEATWLARTGHKVKFRNPNDHKNTDGNTSDAILDGVTCDFKRVTSPKAKKAVREVTGKLDRQGPMFLLDLTESDLTEDEALVRMAQVLDDPSVDGVIVAKNGRLTCLKK